MDLRKVIFIMHRWIGLVAALALLVVAISAALLIFERPLDRLLNSQLAKVPPAGARLPLNEIARRLKQSYPQYHVARWNLPQEPQDALAVGLELNEDVKPSASSSDELDLAVNPYTGAVLGDLAGASDVVANIHRFHTHFLAGKVGSAVVGWSAVCLLALNLTGIILWWRRKIGGFRWNQTGLLLHFNMHQAVGIYAWGFLMVLSLTGIAVHWEREAGRLADWLTASPPPPKMLAADTVPQGALPLDSDQIVSIAEKNAPGARVTTIQIAGAPQGAVRIIMKFPEDHTPAGRTQVYLDHYSGKVRLLINARSAPLGFKLMRLWNRQFHTGDIFGWPTQLLALLSSLALVIMTVTGPLIWYKRKRTSQTAQAAANAPD